MNRIDYILQFDGENTLQVVYKSGRRRLVRLGDRFYNTTKPQADFMHNAKRAYYHNGWTGAQYWYNENSSNREWIEKHSEYLLAPAALYDNRK